MPSNEIQFISGKPAEYTKYTIMPFSNWRALDATSKYIEQNKPNEEVRRANEAFKLWIDDRLKTGNKKYGLFGKQPKSFKEAMERDKFVYWDEYKKIKSVVEKKIAEDLQKSSIAEAMKPKLVFNDKQIGEFVFDRAAMSLQPEIFHYSPSKKREIDVLSEVVIYEGKSMYLAADKSLVVYAIKVEKSEDRMYRIQTKGYDTKEKIIIARNYMLPKIREQVNFNEEDVIIPDDTIQYIASSNTLTHGEDGVRNLKRCLEIIYTKLNLFRLMKPDTENIFAKEINLKVTFPFTVTRKDVDIFIKNEQTQNQSMLAMYC
jgi:hypothetical protein